MPWRRRRRRRENEVDNDNDYDNNIKILFFHKNTDTFFGKAAKNCVNEKLYTLVIKRDRGKNQSKHLLSEHFVYTFVCYRVLQQ